LSDGEIRLVRWLEDRGGAFPQQLAQPSQLREVIETVSGVQPAGP
jgi:hypothetical protein